MIDFKAWLRKISNHRATASRRERRRQRTARPAVETLESRALMSVSTTFVNDNWLFVSDNDNNGVVSYLDEVRNDNDTLNPGAITAFYGLNGFGTVTNGVILDHSYETITAAIAVLNE